MNGGIKFEKTFLFRIYGGESPIGAKMSFMEDFREEMKNPNFAREYKALEPEFEIIDQIIKAHREKNITKKELAQIDLFNKMMS
jgi:hypothetical protein